MKGDHRTAAIQPHLQMKAFALNFFQGPSMDCGDPPDAPQKFSGSHTCELTMRFQKRATYFFYNLKL